jgi:hypothetical protein
MENRHRSRQDPSATASESATLNEVEAISQLIQEFRDLTEIVAVIRVAHYYQRCSRGSNSGHQGTAVASLAHLNYARAEPRRNFSRAIGASIVGNNNLSSDLICQQRMLCLFNADGERIRFIEAWHYYRKFWRFRGTH